MRLREKDVHNVDNSAQPSYVPLIRNVNTVHIRLSVLILRLVCQAPCLGDYPRVDGRIPSSHHLRTVINSVNLCITVTSLGIYRG